MNTLTGTQAQGVPQDVSVIVLENDWMALTVVPEYGGKLVSLRSRHANTEWLLPPLRRYSEAQRTGDFAASDGGGFDECLPTVAESGAAPDHGEVWCLPWRGGRHGACIDLAVETQYPPLSFSRSIVLRKQTAVLQYTVHNGQSLPAEFLWSAHPLLAVEEGDRVVLPPEVARVRVEYSADARIPAEECAWPLAEDKHQRAVDLSRVGPPDGRTAEKLFAGPLQREGWCGLYRPRLRQGIVFRFDPATLPYVGLWICHGAWPETGTAKQYTVAIEPTTANCDALDRAKRNGTATLLGAGESMSWTLGIDILGSDRPIQYEAFCAAAAGQAL